MTRLGRPRAPGVGGVAGRLALLLGAGVMVFPLYWIFATAVRPRAESFARAFRPIPSEFVWGNFAAAWRSMPFADWYANSLIIATLAVVVTVPINLLCGYAFAKYRFPGRDALFLLLLSTLMIPVQVIILPQFLVVARLGGLDTAWGVILPRAAEAFGVFLARQFLAGIPDELIEAARLDGASEWAIFRRVVLPLSKPAIAVLALFTFVWRWNDFAWPIIVLKRREAQTAPLGLNLMIGQDVVDWTKIMAMALVSILPIVVLFALCQRAFVRGLTAGGSK